MDSIGKFDISTPQALGSTRRITQSSAASEQLAQFPNA
jgi:hypothetical protein